MATADTRDWVDEVMTLFEQKLMLEVESPDIDLFESGTLDSLGLVDLLALLDSRFAVRLALDSLDIDQLRSVRRIAELVAANDSTAVPGRAENS